MVPEFPGSEHAITSNETFLPAEFAARMIIVGGGYIGVEFAGIFHGLGVQVTQLYWDRLFLRGFDDDCRETLTDEMRKKGIDLRFDADIEKIEKNGTSLRATLNGGATIEADQILYATGRLPNTASLGLANARVQLNERGSVVVDDYSKTTSTASMLSAIAPNRMMLTPVAIAEGRAVAETLFNNNPMKPNYMQCSLSCVQSAEFRDGWTHRNRSE